MATRAHLGIISTSRADAGIYRPLIIKALRCNYDVTCFVGGTHHRESFGMTGEQFQQMDGARVVKVQSNCDQSLNAFELSSTALPAFADALRAHPVDLVFTLGDRSEMLIATMAAVMLNLPVAHLHGGDCTRGAYDDKFRRAISQLADYHFPALPVHAARLQQMGIDPARIHCVGALAIDAILKRRIPSDEEFLGVTGLGSENPFFTVLFHPETRSDMAPAQQTETVCAALTRLDANMLILGVNLDVGSDIVAKAFQTYSNRHPNAQIIPSLASDIFYECLFRTRCLIGNSSSGIIEATSLQCPVVNIGARQEGRVRAKNVIDVEFDVGQIIAAVKRASAPEFDKQIRSLVNPYGDGTAASAIMNALDKIRNPNAIPTRPT